MKRSTNGQYEISGPGTEGRKAPDVGPALSLAQTLATRPGAAPGTWYVRNPDGDVVFYVERHDDRSVTISRRSDATVVSRAREDEDDAARDAERYGPAVRPMETYGAGRKTEMAEEVSL